MSVQAIPNGQGGYFNYPVGKDANGIVRSVINRTITTDNYAQAYVAPGPSNAQLPQCVVVSKLPIPAGQSIPINVTVNMQDVNGTPLPTVTLPFLLQGPPAPPPASVIFVDGVGAANLTNPPGDPGQATVTF